MSGFNVDAVLGNTAVLAGVAAISLLVLGSYFLQSNRLSDVPHYEVTPTVKKSNQFPLLSKSLAAVFPKFRDGIFRISGIWHETIFIPPKFIEDLKSLPNSTLSFEDLNDQRFMTPLAGMQLDNEHGSELLFKSISNDLTRYLNKIMGDLDEEIEHAFSSSLPACDDWTEVYPMGPLLRIVALASGRIFVGTELNRDEEFLKCTITFTMDTFKVSEELRKYPKVLRPIMARFSKNVQNCQESHRTMCRLMTPVIEQRLKQYRSGQTMANDMTTWNIQNAAERRKSDVAWQARAQLLISMAAIHTTTMTSTNAWFDLAAHPEYIPELREEIEEIVRSEPNGFLSKTSMPRLRKLDSFLKESQRLHPLGLTTFDRLVNKDMVLPDGTFLQKGAVLSVAAAQIARDPTLWENPEEFDGFRFEKLRQQQGNENRYQFVTTGVDSMFFGHGKHACPGRFFAANEIKLILVRLILGYDIKLLDGTSRPENFEQGTTFVPNPVTPVLLKKRVTA